MTEIITTLPIGPQEKPKIGALSILVLMQLLGDLSKTRQVLTHNTLGSKNISAESLSAYRQHLKKLQALPQIEYIDSDREYHEIISLIFNSGVQQGWIKQKPQDISSCSCGKLQYLHIEDHQLYGRKTLVQDNKCSACDSEVKVFRNEDVYVIEVPENILQNYKPSTNVSFVNKDLINHFEFYSGKSILLSRFFRDAFKVNNNQSIDVDFSWMVYLQIMREIGFQVTTMPFGVHCTKQLALSLIVAELMECPLPKEIIAIPYLQLNELSQDITKLLLHHDYQSIRLLLLKALGSRKKDIISSKQDLELIEKSLKLPHRSEKSNDSESVLSPLSIWNSWSTNRMSGLLKSIRKGEKISNKEDIAVIGN
jgi:hypothetical protein